jgi:hypothetical protein
MSKKYFSTGYLKDQPGKIDRENGIIFDVKVNTEGEALGHGYNLDKEFVDAVTQFGNEKKLGLKARFGHPAMCSTALGTFLGRFKNFRTVKTIRDNGNEAYTSIADLHLSEEAKKSPSGDLYEYVLGMAENESDMFGTSIVFSPGKEYQKDAQGNKYYYSDDTSEIDLLDDLFIECKELFACDCVDEPAANDGMFSAFASDTVAGQISKFLDLHPEVFKSLSENKEVIQALAEHGDKIEEFFENYKSYKNQNKETVKMSNKEEKPVEVEVSLEELQVENEALKSENSEPKAKKEERGFEKPAELSAPEDKIAMLGALKDEFGAEIAIDAINADEPYKFAASKLKEQNEALQSEIAGLTEKIAELSAGADPVTPAPKLKKKKSLFN